MKKNKISYVFKIISPLLSSPDFTRSDACVDANKATVGILHVQLSRGLTPLPRLRQVNKVIILISVIRVTQIIRVVPIYDVKRLCTIIYYTTSLWCDDALQTCID